MRKSSLFAWTVILLVCLALAGTARAADKYKGYTRGGEVFITAEELNRLVQAKNSKLVIIAVASRTDYLSGYIPGSFQLWRPDYEAPPETQGGVTDNLIDAEGFAGLMQKIGVDPDSKVVVYDHRIDAPRLWRAFFYYGKTDVRIFGWRDQGLDACRLRD